MRRPLLLLTLAGLVVGGPSCLLAVGAAAGTGYLISREIHEEEHLARVALGADATWNAALETLEILHDVGTEITRDDGLRRAKARVDGSDVELSVEAYDLDASLIRITSEKLLVQTPDTAELVLNETIDRIEGR